MRCIYNEKCHQITFKYLSHTCLQYIEFSSGQGERAKSQWLAYRSSTTVAPTTAPSGPSVAPSSSGPTSAPSSSGYLSCSAYSASNTNGATINYSICSISACPGNIVTMTTLAPGSCTGDTYLILYDPSTGAQLAEMFHFLLDLLEMFCLSRKQVRFRRTSTLRLAKKR